MLLAVVSIYTARNWHLDLMRFTYQTRYLPLNSFTENLLAVCIDILCQFSYSRELIYKQCIRSQCYSEWHLAFMHNDRWSLTSYCIKPYSTSKINFQYISRLFLFVCCLQQSCIAVNIVRSVLHKDVIVVALKCSYLSVSHVWVTSLRFRTHRQHKQLLLEGLIAHITCSPACMNDFSIDDQLVRRSFIKF